MGSILELVNMRDAGAVEAALLVGARACLEVSIRRGSCEVVEVRSVDAGMPAATLIATGDLHDNPLHMARLVRAAGIEEAFAARSAGDDAREPAHLTLHELIHGDRLMNGLDYSYRVLVRAAMLKSMFPERVHVLLANHELAQLTGAQVAKSGVRCNEAFDEAIDVTFGSDAERVRAAVHAFIRALPLGVRFDRGAFAEGEGDVGDIFCAHSLPAPGILESFDWGVLDRALTDDDLKPRSGAAHQMTWGRGHTGADYDLAHKRLGTGLFLLGHELAEEGWHAAARNAVILNSDHDRGVYAKIDLAQPESVQEIGWECVRLADG